MKYYMNIFLLKNKRVLQDNFSNNGFNITSKFIAILKNNPYTTFIVIQYCNLNK